MLEIYDVALGGTAWGKICKTTDGGKSWTVISNGIGDENNKILKTSTKMKIIDENTLFLTMPVVTGEHCELYKTTNCGQTFEKIKVLESNIYDYYNIPTEQDGKLYLKVSQGTDGDYNGGDYKRFYSEDKGNSWFEIKE